MGLFGKSKKEREKEYMNRLDVPLPIVLRCFETKLIFTNGSEDASRFFIALRLALRGKTQRR